MRQSPQEIGLLKFFDCELIWSADDLFLPLVQMWRPEERAFNIRGVMLPLLPHYIYFLIGLLIHGIQEMTHPLLAGQSTLGLLTN